MIPVRVPGSPQVAVWLQFGSSLRSALGPKPSQNRHQTTPNRPRTTSNCRHNISSRARSLGAPGRRNAAGRNAALTSRLPQARAMTQAPFEGKGPTRGIDIISVAAKPLGKMISLVLVFCWFGSVFGQGWPQDPFKRIRLEE